MAQAQPTICSHNYGTVLVAGASQACRGCGAPLRPSPRTTTTANGVRAASEKEIDALYPNPDLPAVTATTAITTGGYPFNQ